MSEGGVVPQELKNALIKQLGSDKVFDDAALLIHYSRCRETVLRKLYNLKVKETPPDMAVTPTDVNDVMLLVSLANTYAVPLIPYGATTVVNIWVVPTRGGIAIDFNKMKSLSIDRETMVVSVGPGTLTNELWAAFLNDPELETWITGGPGQSRVVSHWTFGGLNKTGNFRFGKGYSYIVSVEMVLPDGTLLRTGSSAIPFCKDFWPHGPGPDLTYLPVLAHGEYGVVTKLSLKLNYKPAKRDYIMGVFKDLESMYKAQIALGRLENGRAIRGSTWAPQKIIAPYSAEYFEMQVRLQRAMPRMGFFVVAVEGTERTVKYWIERIKRLIEENGGKVVPKGIMEVYNGYIENIANASIIRSSRIFRKWFGGGRFISGSLHDLDAIQKWEEALYELKVPWYKPWYGGLQLYGAQWNHYIFLEYLLTIDPEDPTTLPLLQAIPKWDEIRLKYNTGMHAEYKDRNAADVFGAYYDLCLRIKRVLDPNNIMSPGVVFPTN